jgi:hypothetical protein
MNQPIKGPFLHWMLKIQKKPAQLGFKPSLGAAENSTGFTAQCNYWGRLEHSM